MNKEDMKLKESKEGYMGMLRERRWREKLCDYIKILIKQRNMKLRGIGAFQNGGKEQKE